MQDQRRTLLIVDDSDVNRLLLANIFNDRYDILEAENGQQALDLLTANTDTICCVLLDLIMPVVSGYDVLRSVQGNQELSKIPIIVISGADQQEEITALKLGAVDFVMKPFEPTITAQRVDSVVRRNYLEDMRIRYLLLQKQSDAEVYLDAIIGNLPGAIFTLRVENGDFFFNYLNETLVHLAAFDSMEQFQAHARNRLQPIIYWADYPDTKEALTAAFRSSSTRADIALRLVNPVGELHWGRLRGSVKTDANGQKQLYCMLINIDKEKEQERRFHKALADLKFRAEYDQLTHIHNAESFYKNTSDMLRAHPDNDYTLVCWNIEQFKLVNNFFPREMADDVLKEIAGVLVRNVKPVGGTFCRLGSDRFAACFPEGSIDISTLHLEAEKRFSCIGMANVINLAAGVYRHAQPDVGVSRMCGYAIIALQSIQGNYLVRVAYFDDRLRTQVMLENEITSCMQMALDNEEFVLFCQPVYNIMEGCASSGEVLVRWQHPGRGLISPGSFIPLFERNGFITKLDPYVWEQTCKFLRQRIDSGKKVVPLSMNISRADLFNPHLSETIIELVDRYGLDHSLTRWEITESAYTDKPDRLIATAQTLRSNGFTVLMDDFGSGYSSLNTLKDLPVDILKIDMRFMENLSTTGRAGNILTSIVRMAAWLNLTTIAEGVETKEQSDFLRSIGCTKVQGYLYAKPMPLDAFSNYLDTSVPAPVNSEMPTGEHALPQHDVDYLLSDPNLFSAALDHLPFAFGLFSLTDERSLELIRVNTAYCVLTGTPAATRESVNVLKLLAPGDRDAMLTALGKSRATATSQQVFVSRRHEDGHFIKLDCLVCYVGGSKHFPFYFILENGVSEKECE